MRPSSDEVLAQINEKARKFQEEIAYSDQKLLKIRLQIAWKETEEVQSTNATAWRKSRAREMYTRIQDASDHLFLAAILIISPTDCSTKSINNIVDSLLQIKDYEPFHLKLSPAAKKFFETTAIEQGFSRARGYLKFIQALFPQSW
jgi:hypothetical protein